MSTSPRVHGRPIAAWPISTSPNMVKKMFDWIPVPNLTTLQPAECHRESPLLMLTVTSACSHELNHNCPCAQPFFVLPAVPGKAQARCPTRFSGTAAHGSVSLLGLNRWRKSWVSQGYKTCTAWGNQGSCKQQGFRGLQHKDTLYFLFLQLMRGFTTSNL